MWQLFSNLQLSYPPYVLPIPHVAVHLPYYEEEWELTQLLATNSPKNIDDPPQEVLPISVHCQSLMNPIMTVFLMFLRDFSHRWDRVHQREEHLAHVREMIHAHCPSNQPREVEDIFYPSMHLSSFRRIK